MATYVLSTNAQLSRAPKGTPGPVTVAIRAMRVADLEAAPSLRSRVSRRAWELFRLDRLAGFGAAMKAAWNELQADADDAATAPVSAENGKLRRESSNTTQASRRRLLFGLAALPVTGAVVVARQSPDAAFLALAPTLLPMLDELDALWARVRPLYALYEQARDACPHTSSLADSGRWIALSQALPEYAAYLDARKPLDRLDDRIEELVQGHMDTPASSLEILLLKHRVGKSLEHYAEDALEDLDRLLHQREMLTAA